MFLPYFRRLLVGRARTLADPAMLATLVYPFSTSFMRCDSFEHGIFS